MKKKHNDLLEKEIEKSNLRKEVDNKIEAFQSKMSTFIQCIEEKDNAIAALENRMNDLEVKLANGTEFGKDI